MAHDSRLKSTSGYSFVTELNNQIHNNNIYLNQHLTITELASIIGTNRTYLSDYFNSVLNTSFYDYINDLRLKRAEEMLSTPNLGKTIEEISELCGYNSGTTFRRYFAKKHGVSPSVFLRNTSNRVTT